jgi:hypothetical protein
MLWMTVLEGTYISRLVPFKTLEKKDQTVSEKELYTMNND